MDLSFRQAGVEQQSWRSNFCEKKLSGKKFQNSSRTCVPSTRSDTSCGVTHVAHVSGSSYPVRFPPEPIKYTTNASAAFCSLQSAATPRHAELNEWKPSAALHKSSVENAVPAKRKHQPSQNFALRGNRMVNAEYPQNTNNDRRAGQHFVPTRDRFTQLHHTLPTSTPYAFENQPTTAGPQRFAHQRDGASANRFRNAPLAGFSKWTSFQNDYHHSDGGHTASNLPLLPQNAALCRNAQQFSHHSKQDGFSGKQMFESHIPYPLSSSADKKQSGRYPHSTYRIHYVEHPEVQKMTLIEAEAICQSLQVTVSGSQHPKPLQYFEHAPFPDWIQKELCNAGYERPYPVQAVGWPVVLSGRDMVGIACTGSGKTLVYLLPAFLHMQRFERLRARDGPVVLVLAPTRELAMQILNEARRFITPASSFSVTCIYGGVPHRQQAKDLERGVHLCIATPGRLINFLDAGVTRLNRVRLLILDEADRMLDMGFEPQIRRIVQYVTSEHQTLMWSATWPRDVQQLARDFCRYDPVKLTVGTCSLQANENIEQVVYVCSAKERFERLLQHLREQTAASHDENSCFPFRTKRKTLIFCETKRGCDQLCHQLHRLFPSFCIAAIHGDKEQRERDGILFEFKSKRSAALIATDVASRGLDIKDIDTVINYDVPKTIEDYIHRIGRTGRAGATGTAITFFTEVLPDTERQRMAREICNVMRDVNQAPPNNLLALADRSQKRAPRQFQYQPRHYGAAPHKKSLDVWYLGRKNDNAFRGVGGHREPMSHYSTNFPSNEKQFYPTTRSAATYHSVSSNRFSKPLSSYSFQNQNRYSSGQQMQSSGPWCPSGIEETTQQQNVKPSKPRRSSQIRPPELAASSVTNVPAPLLHGPSRKSKKIQSNASQHPSPPSYQTTTAPSVTV